MQYIMAHVNVNDILIFSVYISAAEPRFCDVNKIYAYPPPSFVMNSVIEKCKRFLVIRCELKHSWLTSTFIRACGICRNCNMQATCTRYVVE